MSENQLREAYVLMKQGDKAGAARLVQDVLRQDRSNLQAWWLFSHLLEDEEKVVKSLEKVLALNPDHAGARKRLASMRPEYAHLAPTDDARKAKSKTEQQSSAYWEKLSKAQQTGEKTYAENAATNKQYDLLIKGLLALVPILLIFAAVVFVQIQLGIPDKNGDTPQTIATKYYIAMYQEDAETLYAITCPARHERVDEMISYFEGWSPEEVTVDVSALSLDLDDYSDDLAYVTIHGEITIDYGGALYTLDKDQEAADEGYDAYGIFFKRTDNVWQVCDPYYLPDVNYDDN